MNITPNITQYFAKHTPSVINRNNNSYYNTGCIEEISKLASDCADFKLNIAQSMQHRFLISLVVMSVLVLFTLYVKYGRPNFSQTEFWRKYIDYRIDYVIVILLFFNILFVFMM